MRPAKRQKLSSAEQSKLDKKRNADLAAEKKRAAKAAKQASKKGKLLTLKKGPDDDDDDGPVIVEYVEEGKDLEKGADGKYDKMPGKGHAILKAWNKKHGTGSMKESPCWAHNNFRGGCSKGDKCPWKH